MLVWFLWPGGAWQFEPEPFFAFGVAVVVWAFTEFKLSEEVIYRASTPNDIRFGREIFAYGTWNFRELLKDHDYHRGIYPRFLTEASLLVSETELGIAHFQDGRVQKKYLDFFERLKAFVDYFGMRSSWGGSAAPAAWYRFSGDRKGQHPKDHLARFRGWMHADGYAGFEDLYRSGSIREVACMAHVRRKFVDIHRSQGSPIAEEAIARIAQLYAVEKEARGSPPDVRVALRKAHAAPVFDDLELWLAMQLTTISGKSPLAATIRFVGSETGGKAAAIAYTLIETSKLNAIDPHGWLADTIARIPDYKITKVDDFLPWSHAR